MSGTAHEWHWDEKETEPLARQRCSEQQIHRHIEKE